MAAERAPRGGGELVRGAPRAVALIPARLASERLPRKMLLAQTGLPLVVHTAQAARGSGAFARVVVATDAAEIEGAVRAHGFDAARTRVDHASGSDRIHEAWTQLAQAGERADVLVGLQGDEPEIEGEDLRRLVDAFEDEGVSAATLAAPCDEAAFTAASVVKVVRDARGDALYFSRAPIPARGHDACAAGADALRHVGVYAWRPGALARFCALPRSGLERRESLEQLRWLESGERMRVVVVARAPRGIDTAEDYGAFVRRAAERADRASGGGGTKAGFAGARAG